MKKYVYSAHIMSHASDDFKKRLDVVIEDAQNKGFIIEVQYSSHQCDAKPYFSTYSALILGYKEEPNEQTR